MERKTLIVCLAVGFLGLLSAVLSFAAEGTRRKHSHCTFPTTTSPASVLGRTAVWALGIAQVAISIAAQCICCCRRGPRPPNWTLGLVCFIASWFTNVVALLLLEMGVVLNDQNGFNTNTNTNTCYAVMPGVFAGAAVLSLACVTLGIVSYLALNPAKNSNDMAGGPHAPNQGGIAMGQPQFPPTGPPQFPPTNTQAPVFVHEDTYMRRQFT